MHKVLINNLIYLFPYQYHYFFNLSQYYPTINTRYNNDIHISTNVSNNKVPDLLTEKKKKKNYFFF
jgi:hypothetical protein